MFIEHSIKHVKKQTNKHKNPNTTKLIYKGLKQS